MKKGLKYDSEKPRWDLLPISEVEDIVKVLTVGAKKYDDNNWQIVVAEKPKRYYSALMRHVVAWLRGEKNDPETGLPHLAHAGCCLLFLAWNDKK